MSATVFPRQRFAQNKSFGWGWRGKLNCSWNMSHLQILIVNNISSCEQIFRTRFKNSNINLFTFVWPLWTIGKHTVRIKIIPLVCHNDITCTKMIHSSTDLSKALLNCPIVPCFRWGTLTVRIFGQFSTNFHFNFCSILPPTWLSLQ